MTNKQLFETYIHKNINNIYRFAYTYTKNKEEAEDVVHESVLKALKSINSLKNPDLLSTWFYRIVANTALTGIRGKRRMQYVDPADLTNFQNEGDEFSDISFKLMINILEPKYRSIVVLRFFEGLPFEDIACIVNENINTVKTRLYKALKTLRFEMEDSL
jgi:RNA polymerase sigma-70 factor (ECF subfamily)